MVASVYPFALPKQMPVSPFMNPVNFTGMPIEAYRDEMVQNVILGEKARLGNPDVQKDQNVPRWSMERSFGTARVIETTVVHKLTSNHRGPFAFVSMFETDTNRIVVKKVHYGASFGIKTSRETLAPYPTRMETEEEFTLTHYKQAFTGQSEFTETPKGQMDYLAQWGVLWTGVEATIILSIIQEFLNHSIPPMQESEGLGRCYDTKAAFFATIDRLEGIFGKMKKIENPVLFFSRIARTTCLNRGADMPTHALYPYNTVEELALSHKSDNDFLKAGERGLARQETEQANFPHQQLGLIPLIQQPFFMGTDKKNLDPLEKDDYKVFKFVVDGDSAEGGGTAVFRHLHGQQELVLFTPEACSQVAFYGDHDNKDMPGFTHVRTPAIPKALKPDATTGKIDPAELKKYVFLCFQVLRVTNASIIVASGGGKTAIVAYMNPRVSNPVNAGVGRFAQQFSMDVGVTVLDPRNIVVFNGAVIREIHAGPKDFLHPTSHPEWNEGAWEESGVIVMAFEKEYKDASGTTVKVNVPAMIKRMEQKYIDWTGVFNDRFVDSSTKENEPWYDPRCEQHLATVYQTQRILNIDKVVPSTFVTGHVGNSPPTVIAQAFSVKCMPTSRGTPYPVSVVQQTGCLGSLVYPNYMNDLSNAEENAYLDDKKAQHFIDKIERLIQVPGSVIAAPAVEIPVCLMPDKAGIVNINAAVAVGGYVQGGGGEFGNNNDNGIEDNDAFEFP